jgi:hypothetical protein
MRKGLGRHSTAAGTVWPNGPFFCGRFGGVFEQPSHPNPAPHRARGRSALVSGADKHRAPAPGLQRIIALRKPIPEHPHCNKRLVSGW